MMLYVDERREPIAKVPFQRFKKDRPTPYACFQSEEKSNGTNFGFQTHF